MKFIFIFFAFFAGLFALSGCTDSQHLAPVTNGWASNTSATKYRVQKEDQLYSIAFRYGLDYRKLAEINHLSPPYHVVPGQTLILLPEASETSLPASSSSLMPSSNPEVMTGAAPAASVTSQPAISSPAAEAPVPVINSTGPVGQWLWPASGTVTHVFSDAYGGNKGIDITGKAGDSVKATAAGKVVYSGSGLKGYGLLIIIKHNDEYLSAYAHSSKLLVKEGDTVKAGQEIALMGDTDAGQVLLHFEIRKAGKPVDPLKLLTPR